MSEVTGPPNAKTPSTVTHSAERTQAIRPAAKEGDRQQHQTSQQQTSGKNPAEEASRAQYRDPAVSIAAATAHMEIGEEFQARIKELDEDGRPIIVTDTAVLALRPDAGLRPGDDIELRITDTTRGIKADLDSRNGTRLQPPLQVTLTVIALHKSDTPSEAPLPASEGGTTTAGYSPKSLRQQYAATMSAQNEAISKAESVARELSPLDGNTITKAEATSMAAPAITLSGFGTLTLGPDKPLATSGPAVEHLNVETHLPAQLPKVLPAISRSFTVESITRAVNDPVTGDPAVAVKIATGTLYLPTDLAPAIRTGDPLILIPARTLKWPDSSPAEQAGPVFPSLSSKMVRGDTSITANRGLSTLSASLVLAQEQIQRAANIATGQTRPAPRGLPGLPLIAITQNVDGQITAGAGKPSALIMQPPGSGVPDGATPFRVKSAVPLTQAEISSLGLAAPAGFRAVRLSSSAGQFAALLPRGTDPTREQTFIKPMAGLSAPGNLTAGGVMATSAEAGTTVSALLTGPTSDAPPRQVNLSLTRPNGSAAGQPVFMTKPYQLTPGSAAQITLHTNIGVLQMNTPDNWPSMPVGTPLYIEPVAGGGLPAPLPDTIAGPPPAGSPSMDPATLTMAGWPALSATFQASLMETPRTAAALSDRTAAGGARLTNSLLFMMKAMGAEQAANSWLGKDIRQTLEQSGKQSLLDQLRSDLGRLFAAAGDADGDWRPVFIPFDSHENAPMLTLLLRQDSDNREGQRSGPGAEDDDSDATRFIVEVSFSVIGAMQLEGRIAGNQFDLQVRSHEFLGANMEQDLRHLFEKSLLANDFTGRLMFETLDNFPVSAADYLPA